MFLSLVRVIVLLLLLATESLAYVVSLQPNRWIKPYKRAPLQDIVTWDEHSLFVHGERILFYSGEFHPFRLPVPSLWLDIFQKIKAAGFNGVSFYVDWALLEGNPGHFRAEGIFAWEPFFEAATNAGIYLLARPGPYINAEVSGGGFPGWLQRVNGTLRTRDSEYLKSTENYVKSIGEIIAKAQITNGGPVILFQPENEYCGATENITPFPDPVYFGSVQEQYRKAGIVVPFVNNDAWTAGFFAPGKESAVDIYGHDGYPLGFDCANPNTWPDNALPTNWGITHFEQSPSTPYAIIEFQGGAFDPWGGNGFEKCAQLLNHEFARVFYKNNYGFGATIFNVYMTYGGTNWGNLGHTGGYSSYDYAAIIAENRQITREKYSEVKLQANFLKVSSNFLVATRGNSSTSLTTSAAITVTPALTNSTTLYFTRQTKYNSLETTKYKLIIQTKLLGNISVPQLNGSLTINGRDSKVHVSDYKIGQYNLIYSSAEIFTWQKYSDKTILIVYGGQGEQHELAVETTSDSARLIEGNDVNIVRKKSHVIIGWVSSLDRRVIDVNDDLYIYILDRNAAYNYWVIDLPSNSVSTDSSSSVVIRAGYLIRTAEVKDGSLSLVGDVNSTTTLEILGGIPNPLSKLVFNSNSLAFDQRENGDVTATIKYSVPRLVLPKLNSLLWKYIDSLPEIQRGYVDNNWTKAALKSTPNTLRPLTTPTSLYAGDYGYQTGTLIFRGQFKANGNEEALHMQTQGGSAFGMSVWLNSGFLGSFTGFDAAASANSTFTLPNLVLGADYTITIVIDSMGLDGNWVVGADITKSPRGILDYDLSGHEKSDVTWKVTGNLGGEDYRDLVRGPLNEGGLYVERQGYHLPAPPISSWKDSQGPTAGLRTAGIGFFVTRFDLELPSGYDIPLSFVFANSTSANKVSAYRAQLFVNGYQFGKYINNIGPQTRFPVPEGILNYHGENWVGVTLWALGAEGAKVEGLELVSGTPVQSGYGNIELSPTSKWAARPGAY